MNASKQMFEVNLNLKLSQVFLRNEILMTSCLRLRKLRRVLSLKLHGKL